VQSLLDELLSQKGPANNPSIPVTTNNPLPVLGFELKKVKKALQFFSTLAMFGSPQDVT
jgi:hypothetical protein